jgi:hypothetical protein
MNQLPEKFPVSDFVTHLIAINRLDMLGFGRFVFFPGMLFLANETWWSKNGIRKTAHEGLDICFFITAGQQLYRLDETIRIPILFEGRIVGVMEDFLGQTVVARHLIEGPSEKAFLSFYAHITPDHRIRPGGIVKTGEPLGTISDSKKINSPLPPHLHISLAWESMLPPVAALTWNVLNRADRSAFIDPLAVFPKSHIKFKAAPDEHAVQKFTACGFALKAQEKEKCQCIK